MSIQDDIDQLIRLAQVLKARSNSIAATIDGLSNPADNQMAKAREVAILAMQAQTKLEQIYDFFAQRNEHGN